MLFASLAVKTHFISLRRVSKLSLRLCYTAIRPFCDRAAANSKEELGILELDEDDLFLEQNPFQNTYNQNIRPKAHQKKSQKLTVMLVVNAYGQPTVKYLGNSLSPCPQGCNNVTFSSNF